MSGARWSVGILGVWLIVAAFLGMASWANLWNNLLVGVFISGAAFSIGLESKWEGWTAGIFGVWLMASAFIPAFQEGTGLLWNDLLVGLVIAAMAFVPAANGQMLHAHHHG